MTRPEIKTPNAIIVSDGAADPRLVADLPLSSLKPSVPRRRTANIAAARQSTLSR